MVETLQTSIEKMILEGRDMATICHTFGVTERQVLAVAFLLGKKLRPDMTMPQVVSEVMKARRVP